MPGEYKESAVKTLKRVGNIAKYALCWVPVALVVGILAGSASALLLASLELATQIRESHRWIITLLPLAGLAVGCLYHYFGTSVERGNDLILDQIHLELREPRTAIPLRMSPLILIGTFVTHLFGGSAGREGTAIQAGASLADQLAAPLRLDAGSRRVLLMIGISAGFASVFGTPFAGAIFGTEVLAIGLVGYEALFPCLVGAFAGDVTTRAWHIHHPLYSVGVFPTVSLAGIFWAVIAGAAFGMVSQGFVRSTHMLSTFFRRIIRFAPLRPFAGGVLVALGVFGLRTTRYVGLGIPTIQASFYGLQPSWDWVGKWVFTSVTLGAGFKGGEVTPLFFIGATLGNALSRILPLPPGLLAGMGFVGVFAGASNTPIASTIMALELFGGDIGAYAGVACLISYLLSGDVSIYGTQRSGRGKFFRR